MQLGQEVGLPAPYLRQALMEERTRGLTARERGLVAWLAGPRHVAASRTITGTPAALEPALAHWMKDGELLQVKRRYPDRTAWEAQHGAFASIKRSLGGGGRRYALAQASDVSAWIVPVDEHRSHVRLVGDLANTRREHFAGATVVTTVGLLGTGAALLLGVAPGAALVPAMIGLAVAVAVARARRRKLERFHVALEQVLDRLEHGEIRVPVRSGARPAGIARIADEIRKSLGA